MTLSDTDQSIYIRTLILMSVSSPQGFQIVMIKLSIKVEPTTFAVRPLCFAFHVCLVSLLLLIDTAFMKHWSINRHWPCCFL